MWTQPNQARIVKWRKWTLRKLKSCFGHEHTLATNKYRLCWNGSTGNINVYHIICCCLWSKDQCIKTNNTMDTGFPSAKIHTWSLMCNESSNSFNPLWTTPLPHNDHSPLHPRPLEHKNNSHEGLFHGIQHFPHAIPNISKVLKQWMSCDEDRQSDQWESPVMDPNGGGGREMVALLMDLDKRVIWWLWWLSSPF